MNLTDAGAQAFMDEAYELLGELEESLLELESNPEDMECIAKVFRSMHTIKGSGAMFGFEEISRFTHEVETTFDMVREGKLPLQKELLTLTLEAKDHVTALLEVPPEGDPDSRQASDELIAKFKQYSGAAGSGNTAPAAAESAPEETPPAQDIACPPPPGQNAELFWVRYRPEKQTFISGARPLGLLEELSELGDIYRVIHNETVPLLTEIVPEDVYCWWDILLVTDKGENSIRDVFIFVENEAGLDIHRIGQGAVRASDLDALLDIFVQNPEAPLEAISIKISAEYQKMLSFRGGGKAAEKQAAPKKVAVGAGAPTSIRVDSGRLDSLVNMVGELVIIQSRLSLACRRKSDPVIKQINEDLSRLTDEMRDNALGIRMTPLATTFNAFRRLVRDLSNTLNKEVEFITEGEETELDKTVIDKLKDPLMHILRNSLDHGIESQEERIAAGKPEKGRVRITAVHSSGDVLISVHDDGAGINRERVLAKAIERGIVSPDDELSTDEIDNLIFRAGFSTAQAVSNVSGRGVGMDVVKKSIDALHGSVELKSEQGVGATITVRLPLTLAIIDGLLVKIGDESFILPLALIEACQERFVTGEVKQIEPIERMEKMIPCISLRKLFNVPGPQPDYERVLIAHTDGYNVGLAVDLVVDRQQAVIKSMDEMYKDLNWISGTTITGDGGISLIVDIKQVVRYAQSQSELERRLKRLS